MPAKTADQAKAADQAESRTPDVRIVAFSRCAVAPENMRFKEPADEQIPQLARTMLAAGNVTPIIVRPGKGSKESEFMILEGRRRYLAVEYLIEQGHATDAFELKIEVETDPARQAAAVMLTNTERLPVHVADVIVAIGKMRKAKLTTTQIADALGHDELEIKRYEKLSSVDPKVLEALRANRINLKQAKLIARFEDKKEQKRFAEEALNGHFAEWRVRQAYDSRDGVTETDRRVALVGLDAYVAAGGRAEQDLFGDFPTLLVDTAKLNELWIERMKPVVEALEAEGLTVFVEPEDSNAAPEGFEHLPYSYPHQWSEQKKTDVRPWSEALEEARNAFRDAALQAGDPQLATFIASVVVAKLREEREIHDERKIGAVVLSPGHDRLVDSEFFSLPYEEPEDDLAVDDADDLPTAAQPVRRIEPAEVVVPKIEVDTEGSTHALHENYTDYATRGLIRAVADDPGAALTFIVAQLFSQIGLSGFFSGSESASTIRAERYSRIGVPAIAELDGEVSARLDAHREAYKASEFDRPIAWIDSLAHGDKMNLLAELVAMSLNIREFRTTNIRTAARAQAAELAGLTAYDISAYWVPDAKFLSLHSKKQLLGLLEEMGEDDAEAKTLKKNDLVAFVGERCAAKRFAPARLGWSIAVAEEETVEDDAAADASETTDGETPPIADEDAAFDDGQDDASGAAGDDEDRFDPDFEEEFDRAA
jgi:ParB family chromosome partitioning protein